MNRKILVAVVVVAMAVLGIAATGFGLAYAAVQRVEAALQGPIDIGPVKFVPGQVNSRIGFFTSDTAVTDSQILWAGNTFHLARLHVELQGDRVISTTPLAEGTMSDGGNASFSLRDLRVETDLLDVTQTRAVRDATVTVGHAKLARGGSRLSLEDVGLDVHQERHAYWDALDLRVQKANLDDRDVSIEARGLALRQTQEPAAAERLAVTLNLTADALAVKGGADDLEMMADGVSMVFDMEINGNERTVFFDTLRDWNWQNDTRERYVFKYRPTIGGMKMQADAVDLRADDGALTVAHVAVNSSNAPDGDLTRSVFSLVMNDGDFTSPDVSLKVAAATWESELTYSRTAYEALAALSERAGPAWSADIAQLLYELLDNLESNHTLTFSGVQARDRRTHEPWTLDEAQFVGTLVFKEGFGNASLDSTFRVGNIAALPPMLQGALPVGNLEQHATFYAKNINLKAFEALLSAVDTARSEALIALTDEALRTFAADHPGVGLDWSTATRGGPRFALAVSFFLDRVWPRDFSVGTAFADSTQVEAGVQRLLAEAATVRVNLTVEEYQKLVAMVDQALGPGTGDALVQSARQYFVIEGSTMKAAVVIRGDEATLNGEPNAFLQDMFKQAPARFNNRGRRA